jgi:hypothetical protein
MDSDASFSQPITVGIVDIYKVVTFKHFLQDNTIRYSAECICFRPPLPNCKTLACHPSPSIRTYFPQCQSTLEVLEHQRTARCPRAALDLLSRAAPTASTFSQSYSLAFGGAPLPDSSKAPNTVCPS